ncbi:RHS repeat-associated core domain-containing protein, partial [Solimicrobium silvestre]|uniref:RHS repeat-associated core domain-containing protein n=1 Tax=Solimicrobium silvestre TaxID=2099400 RepID=UPI001FAE826B
MAAVLLGVLTQQPAMASTKQTITFAALAGKTYGAAPFTVSAKSSAGLTVAFSSTTTAVCTVSGSTVTVVAPGTCTLDANQAGNTTYSAATQVAQSFVVAKEAQTITFAALTGKSYGTAPFTVSATSSAKLAATFTSATTAICTVSGSIVTLVAPGTCTIDANQAGNVNYNAAPQVAESFTVTKGTQTITFAALTGKSYGTAPFTVSATSSTNLAVAFTSATTSVCTVSGSTVTLVAPGTCTIDANQAGNTDYSAAPQVAQSMTVAKEAQTISFATLAGKTYGAAPFAVSATSSANLGVVFTSATTSVCTVSGSTVTLVAPGTCTINANQAGNTLYSAAAQVANSLTVATEVQTITFAALAGKPYGAAPFTVSATSSANLAVAFTSATTSVCTVSGSTVTLLAGGTCTINANQVGNTTYSAAPQVANSFAVTTEAQTISFTAPATQQFGAALFALSATSSSGLAVSFMSSTTPVCTVSGSTVTLVSAGTCTINANQTGSSNYSAATQVTQSFTVTAEAQTISFTAPATQQFGAAPFALSATSSSGLAISFMSSTTPVCTVSGSIVTLVSAGTCTITANQVGSSNYSAAMQVTQSFIITAEAQTINFAAPGNQQFGAAPFALTATSSSGLAISFTSSTTPVCTVSGSTVTLVTAGTCTIAADQAGSSNFSAAPEVSQSFTVTAEAQTISFTAPANQQFGAAPFALTVTSSSGLAVSLASTTTPVCTVLGSTVTLVSAGTCTIAANQVGSSIYSPATPVMQSFTVTAAPLVITLTSPTTAQSLTAPAALTLTATATDSSGTITQVAFFNGIGLMGTVTQPPYSIVIPNTVAGSYQLTAQVTDSNGLIATSTPVNITVAAGSGSKTEQIYYINADQLNTPRLITDSDGNTVWKWDGEAFGNTPPTAETTGAGPFTFNLRFPGQYYDAETNLHYNYFRDYDPTTGRYAESDPFGLYAGISTFSYVASN